MEKERERPIEIEKEIEKAKNIALRYLSYRPRSIAEVNKKLVDKKFNNLIIDKTIELLISYKFIDDEQFTREWIRYRNLIKPMGRKRLMQELYLKGISKEIILSAFEEITDEDELSLVKEIISKKIARQPLNDVELEKFKQKLIRRGFSLNIISKGIREMKYNIEL